MLSKLLKKDLKRNMRWYWILLLGTIIFAGITRGCKELGTNISFFKLLGILFDTIFYALAINTLLQPFLRNILNFAKSLYSDESYLTHTLPVTKNQIINSKFLTALIEMILGFLCLLVSILIMFGSPTMFDTLKLILSTVISGNFSLFWTLTFTIVLIIVEFLMFLSIIFFSIVLAYKSKEKRLLKTFLIASCMASISITVLSIFMVIVLLINKVNLVSTTLTLSNTAFISIIITGIIVYSAIIFVFYFLTKREFNKGVNID